MSFREEKSRNKLAQLEKLGIELKAPEGDNTAANVQTEQNFYNPLATASQGKYAEQIQKRKLLWANKVRNSYLELESEFCTILIHELKIFIQVLKKT